MTKVNMRKINEKMNKSELKNNNGKSLSSSELRKFLGKEDYISLEKKKKLALEKKGYSNIEIILSVDKKNNKTNIEVYGIKRGKKEKIGVIPVALVAIGG